MNLLNRLVISVALVGSSVAVAAVSTAPNLECRNDEVAVGIEFQSDARPYNTVGTANDGFANAKIVCDARVVDQEFDQPFDCTGFWMVPGREKVQMKINKNNSGQFIATLVRPMRGGTVELGCTGIGDTL